MPSIQVKTRVIPVIGLWTRGMGKAPLFTMVQCTKEVFKTTRDTVSGKLLSETKTSTRVIGLMTKFRGRGN